MNLLRYSADELLEMYVASSAGGNRQLEAEMMADAKFDFCVDDELQDVEGLSDGDGDEPETDHEEEIVPPSVSLQNLQAGTHQHDPVLKGADQECFALLKQIQAREEADRITLEDIVAGKSSVDVPEVHDHEVQRLGCKAPPLKPLDKSSWEELRSGTPSTDASDAMHVAHDVVTLAAAFNKVRVGREELPCLDPALEALWCLLVKLRTGCDEHLLPCPEKIRLTKANLNWFNIAQKQAAVLRAIIGLPAKRTSRAAAWRNLAAGLKKDCEWSEDSVEVASGQVVLYVPPRTTTWRVGLVMTVWRYTAKKQQRTGARPVTMPIPLDVARYIRVCEMTPFREEEGLWRCKAQNPAVVCDVNRVGLFLQTSEIQPHMDGLQARLTEKSMNAVRKAHLWTDWPDHLKNCNDFRTAKEIQTAETANKRKRPDRPADKGKAKGKSVGGVTIIDDDEDEEVAAEDAEAPAAKDAKGDGSSKKLLKSLSTKGTATTKETKQKQEIAVPWFG